MSALSRMVRENAPGMCLLLLLVVVIPNRAADDADDCLGTLERTAGRLVRPSGSAFFGELLDGQPDGLGIEVRVSHPSCEQQRSKDVIL